MRVSTLFSVYFSLVALGNINSHFYLPSSSTLKGRIAQDTPSENKTYRKISNIRRTKSQNLNDSHLVLKSSLPNPFKPGVELIMKM